MAETPIREKQPFFMADSDKTREELLAELEALRQRIDALEHNCPDAQQAEQALRDSETKSRTIIEHSPDGIVLTDEAGRVVEWNAGLVQITGIPAEQALGTPLWEMRYRMITDELRDDDLYAMLREEIQHALQSGTIAEEAQEFEIHIATGERRIVQQRAFIHTGEHGYRLGAIIRDVTAIRQAVRAMRESENHYRTLFEQSPIPLWEEDFSQLKLHLDQLRADGVDNFEQYFAENPAEILNCVRLVRVLDVNQATLDLARARHKTELTGMLNPNPSPEEIDLLREQLLAVARGSTTFAGEGWGRNLAGEPVSLSLRWVAVSSHERTLSKVIVSMTDTTQQRRANSERERLILDLNAFAHTVAHDLKNPLGGITGYASLLNNNLDYFIPEEIRRYLTLIERDGHKMASIIDELLLLSSVRDMNKVELAPLDMLYIIAGSMSRLSYVIEEFSAEITLPATEFPVAYGYSAWVEEVWANYLSNAIKYGGNPPRIEVGGEDLHNGTARFWVRDNGQGLSEEQQEQLFMPFTRLDQAQTEGHGLGLSIVRRIIERLNGTVSVESTPGVGSVFYFTLPTSPIPPVESS